MTDDDTRAPLARLSFDVSDVARAREALTHPSYAREHGVADYERLEFLGDAVIGFVVATHLFQAAPEDAEGELTRMKNSLISGKTLAGVSRDVGLQSALLVSESAADAAEKSSVLENAFEALVGAVFLERGIDGARDFVLAALGERANINTLKAAASDPKSALQEIAQARGLGLPVYEIVSHSGPPHLREFIACVAVEGRELGRGAGSTKQEAQRAAAEIALRGLGMRKI